MNVHAATLAVDVGHAALLPPPDRETLVSCSECGRPICEDCMTFAPVGIRCPDHANLGAVKPTPTRTLRTCASAASGGTMRRRR